MKHLLLVGLLLLMGTMSAKADIWPKRLKVNTEIHNETEAPSLSRHVRDAHRITSLLDDALLLTTAQRYAVARCTVAERSALVLAGTDADFQQAQAQYLKTLYKVLALNQISNYGILCRVMARANQPLDGRELASR